MIPASSAIMATSTGGASSSTSSATTSGEVISFGSLTAISHPTGVSQNPPPATLHVSSSFSISNIPPLPTGYQIHGSSAPFPSTPSPNYSIRNPFTAPYTGGYHSISTSLGSSLNQSCPVKLDRNNYLLWKFSVFPVIRGHKLDSHLLGTSVYPPPYTTIPGTNIQLTRITNLVFEDCVSTDQLLIGWLLGSMTEQILSEVVGSSTAHELWMTLETLYNSQCESQMLEYKDALTKTTKGNSSMAYYLTQMKGYSDKLAAAGYPITKSELILATLGGLGKDYESAIVNITSPEVQSQLITHERLIARLNHTP